ncbi:MULTISPECIES: fasciclin domain-containing protein [unclassified Chitinophaga]|uniref:fasciclin domain-containing protein n=1 Tax=unclassified Chitinophaga TaxID=2619133 RepID=UPI00300F95C2
MKKHTYHFYKCPFTFTPLIVFVLLLSFACGKEKPEGPQTDNSRITKVLADNFNLSLFSTAVKHGIMDKTLLEDGPFTVLAPSDAAFALAGYSDIPGIITTNADVVSSLVRYHVIDGRIELEKLPYGFNQELTSRGGKLYVTHWIRGLDTAITINGARVMRSNIAASNGNIQVLNRVLQPAVHSTLAEAVASDENLTLFAQAMKVSGLLDTVASKGLYTIFAPNNAAMVAQGYATVQQINETAPAVLKKLLSYHILRNRRFISDYILSAGPADTNEQVMLDGNKTEIVLLQDPAEPGGFGGISLKGAVNTDNVYLQKQDMAAGNGVLHILNGVLLAAP